VRIYVPATLDLLAGWVAAGEVPTAGSVAAPDEQEESEYAALLAAADASAALLGGVGRRVVVVARTAGRGVAVPLREVVAVHADTEEFDPAEVDPPELGWFATQEIPDLLG
jgi:hypothetical protein